MGTDWQNEVWIFNEGNLLVLTSNNGKEDTLALGVYKVKTTLSDAFIEVSGLQRAPYLNTTYTIDKLDDSVLSIYGTDGLSGNGNVYREFTKK